MRISDWSSDVCSSDLQPAFEQQRRLGPAYNLGSTSTLCGRGDRLPRFPSLKTAFIGLTHKRKHITQDKPEGRSEEHTSELQSLMRISYAVFCMKKKKCSDRTQLIKQHRDYNI